MTGFGPIEPLLKDPTVNDILINTHKKCFVERFGKLEATSVHFKDEAHLMRIVQRIVAYVGRRVDDSPRPSTLDCLMDHASMSRSDLSRLMARWFRSGSSQKPRSRWIALSSSTRFDLRWQIC